MTKKKKAIVFWATFFSWAFKFSQRLKIIFNQSFFRVLADR